MLNNEEDVNNNEASGLDNCVQYLNQEVNRLQITAPYDSRSSTSATLELMQINGRKVLGPPEDWKGPPPTSACELFIRCIPRNINERKLLEPFLRFGCIYEFRLPMDFCQKNRGYAYVKYTTEEEADCAMEVLNHYYLAPRCRLEISHSYEKCRLFVTNIPKHLDEEEIEEKLRSIFPNMLRIYFKSIPNANEGVHLAEHNSNVQNNNVGGNRGYVFVQFGSHAAALEAKKSITPGLVRLWGRDLKVVWAHTDHKWDFSKRSQSKTVFARNVDLTVNNRDLIQLLVQYVPRTTIRKISKVRTTAFFEFTTREAAEWCINQLQGVVVNDKRLDLEWAKPSQQHSLHSMHNTDFDGILRLKCIANNWGIPVVIFGCYYEQQRLQYGAVVLRDNCGNMRALYCIMYVTNLVDIHSRMCEVVCTLIETIGTFPDCNYVFLVEKDTVHLLGVVNHNVYAMEFTASCGVPHDVYFDWNELNDLSWAVASLMHSSEECLLAAYIESFKTQSDFSYMNNWPLISHRIFGTISPNYRNKPSLKYNLNNTQIVLALCYKVTGTNVVPPTRSYMAFAACTFDKGFKGLTYTTLTLLPMALTQSRFNCNHVVGHVQFRGNKYYHPTQQIMVPPISVNGCTYSESLKQPQIYSNHMTYAAESLVEAPTTTNKEDQQQQLMYVPQQQHQSNVQSPLVATLSSVPSDTLPNFNDDIYLKQQQQQQQQQQPN